MSAEHTSDPEAADSPGSVFGNLPDSRPGTRSPRRDRDAKAAAQPASPSKRKPKSKPEAKTAPKPRPAPKPGPAPSAKPRRAPEPAEQPEGGGGIEDLAWAGVAAAAEAATLGVRLASRAIEALRGSPEGKPEERD